MKTKIVKGSDVSKAIGIEMRKDREWLQTAGIKPVLAIVRVGEDKSDAAYERGARSFCEKMGITVKQILLQEDTLPGEMAVRIEALNQDNTVHGILVMRPILNPAVAEAARTAVSPLKDVDGITALSLSGVLTGQKEGFAPCTAQACMEILDYLNVDVRGKKVTVVGSSLVVGKPVAMLLLNRFATVTLCHIFTKYVPLECRAADIIIAAAGSRGLIGAQHVRAGQIILDVGINVDEENKICGDIDRKSVEGIVDVLTPVPGGVGTVTSAVLAKHVIMAAVRQQSCIGRYE